jgi:hypothetical protein
MTVPYDNDLYLAVTPGGAVTLQVTFETYYGSGLNQPVSDALLAITPVAGGSPVLSTSSLTTLDEATYTYQWITAGSLAAGDYTVTWTGTGPDGTITYSYNVVAVPLATESPSPGIYATAAQYQAWSGDTITPLNLVNIWCRRASEVIDHALIGAVYTADPDGFPLDAATRDVFMRACCAQVEFMIANNDRANVKWMYASTSVGGVSAVRATGATGGPLPKLAPQAIAILRVAGVLSSAPLVNW